LEIKTKDEAGTKSKKTMMFRISVERKNDERSDVRFQISNDDQLEYLFEVTSNQETLDSMKGRPRVELDLTDFPNVVGQQILALLRECEMNEADRRYKVIFTDLDGCNPGSDEVPEDEDE
jgi:hypothetical protein